MLLPGFQTRPRSRRSGAAAGSFDLRPCNSILDSRDYRHGRWVPHSTTRLGAPCASASFTAGPCAVPPHGGGGPWEERNGLFSRPPLVPPQLFTVFGGSVTVFARRASGA
eukprot:75079-Alexandrium_andersonii.AAC.1